MGNQNREQRDSCIQNGSDRRVNRLLSPGNEEERNSDVRDPQHQGWEPFLQAARQLYTLDKNDRNAKQKTKEDAKSDQCDRTDFLYRDLDPHKGGTPDRAQQDKYKPVFEFQGLLLLNNALSPVSALALFINRRRVPRHGICEMAA
jgi:hypothetical protein